MAHCKKAKLNIPMCVACVLFCLTLFSFHLCGGLYARYTARGSASDSARVIKFGELTLTETGDFFQPGKLLIIPGVDLTKRATVDFSGSEAATYVFVSITAPSWSMAGDKRSFSLSVNGKDALRWSVASGWTHLKTTGNTYVYYRALDPNTPLSSADVFANEGTIDVSEEITKDDLAAMTDVSIALRAAVVQLNGFTTPEAAWDSLAAK